MKIPLLILIITIFLVGTAVANTIDIAISPEPSEPSVVPISPLDKTVGPGDLLDLNVSVNGKVTISSVTVNVSGVNDTVNEAILSNVDGYWVNNSIVVDTISDGTHYLSIHATDTSSNSNTSMSFSVVRDSFVTVGSEGKDYTTIQDAINNTYDGDSIEVYPGIYEETLDVDKGLIIQAESDDPSETVIRCNDSFQNSLIRIFPGEMARMNVTISGFTIDGDGCADKGVDTHWGLPLYDLNLTDNLFKDIVGEGISVTGINNVNLLNNSFINTSGAIEVSFEPMVTPLGVMPEERMEISPTINVIGNNMTNISEFGIQIGSDSRIFNNEILKTRAIPVCGQSVIENNHIILNPDQNLRYTTTSRSIPSIFYGIVVLNANSSIRENVVTCEDAEFEGLVGGIISANLYSLQETRNLCSLQETELPQIPNSTIIEDNIVENTTVGLLIASPEGRIVNNEINMTRIGMLSFSTMMFGMLEEYFYVDENNLNSADTDTLSHLMVNSVNMLNDTITKTDSGIVINPEMTGLELDTIYGEGMESSTSINGIENNLTDVDGLNIKIAPNSEIFPIQSPSFNGKYVIEHNHVTLNPELDLSLPSSTALAPSIPPIMFGIVAFNANSSIKENVVTCVDDDVAGLIGGIFSINLPFYDLSTNLDGNFVENTTIGMVVASPDTRVVNNDINMAQIGMLCLAIPNEGEILDNTLDNTRMGVLSLMMVNTTLENNIINNTRTGILSLLVENNTIQGNSINNGTWNNSGAGIALVLGINNTVVDNTVSISPNGTMSMSLFSLPELSYSLPEPSNPFEDKSVGIVMFANRNSSIKNNQVNNAGIGLKIRNATNNELSGNIVDNSDYGLLISDIPYSNLGGQAMGYLDMISGVFHFVGLSENFVTNCMPSRTYANSDNVVTGNTVKNSGMYGVYLSDSINTTIYNNYFNNYNNTMLDNASINNTSWNISKTSGKNIVGGKCLGGNYWVHPDGTGFSVNTADSNGDNICDAQYDLCVDEIDHLPLAPVPEPEDDSGRRAYVGSSMPQDNVKETDSGIKNVLVGSKVEYDFSGSDGPVLGISFEAKEDKGAVVGKVQLLREKPADVGDTKGRSYQMMSITVGSEGTISDGNSDNIQISFKVSKKWIEENNIDESTIRMTRFHDGKWQDLPSNQVGEDDEYIYFYAQTPGFSIFSIVGDEYGEVVEEVVVEEPEVEQQSEEPASEEEAPGLPGFTSMIAVALIAGAAIVLRKRA